MECVGAVYHAFYFLSFNKLTRLLVLRTATTISLALRPSFTFKPIGDIIYQTVNLLFDCHEPTSNGYDYRDLMNAGINIFNVDLTKHDMKFFNIVKEGILACDKIGETYSSGFYTPIGFSVMISVKEPYEIDDRVDIIILKDIERTEELFKFRKQNKKFSSMPILSWPLNLRVADLNELIKMSAGVILDQSFCDGSCDIVHVLEAAKDAFKPVFHFELNMIQDFYDDVSCAQLRRMLEYSSNIIKYGLDGIIVEECVGLSSRLVTQSLAKALHIADKDVHLENEFWKRSFQIPLPVIAPKATAFAASMAALKSKAETILVLTTSGASARILTYASPPCRILAITAHDTAARQMHLFKKVMPLYYNKERKGSWHEERWARIVFGTQFGLEIGLFDFTAKLVVLAPTKESVGYCDSFQIVRVPDVLRVICGDKYYEPKQNS